MKRRTFRKGLPPAPAVVSKSKAATAKQIKPELKKEPEPKKEPEAESGPPRQQAGAHAGPVGDLKSNPVASVPATKAGNKKPALKHEGSDLFKSFAKAKPRQAKTKSAEASPAPDSVS